jgi:hypothetical protein
MPAIPGKVNVACNRESAATIITKLNVKAILGTRHRMKTYKAKNGESRDTG